MYFHEFHSMKYVVNWAILTIHDLHFRHMNRECLRFEDQRSQNENRAVKIAQTASYTVGAIVIVVTVAFVLIFIKRRQGSTFL